MAGYERRCQIYADRMFVRIESCRMMKHAIQERLTRSVLIKSSELWRNAHIQYLTERLHRLTMYIADQDAMDSEGFIEDDIKDDLANPITCECELYCIDPGYCACPTCRLIAPFVKYPTNV